MHPYVVGVDTHARNHVYTIVTATGVVVDTAQFPNTPAAHIQCSEAAPLVDEPGIGVITAATCLTVWSHHGRVRTEAEFAALAGVNPIPASSGNTIRHRLNRGGDRALNKALHMVAISKMTTDPETQAYVTKRRAQGKTDREIRRCIKRYLARRIFKILNRQATLNQPG
jgi:transposase